MNDVKCTILISDVSNSDMISNLAELAIYKVNIINFVSDLNQDLLANSRRVVVIGHMVDSEIKYLQLMQHYLSLEVYYLGADDVICRIFSKFAKSFKVDYTRFDYSFLVSMFYNDRAFLQTNSVDKFTPITTSVNLAKKFSNSSDKDMGLLANEFLLLNNELSECFSREDELLKRISDLELETLSLHRTASAFMDENSRLVSEHANHHTQLSDYQVMLTTDLYDTININKYKSRPKIIYLKEHTEFLHLESFIRTITDMIRVQLNRSFKVIRLHDSVDVNRVKLVRENYLTTNGNFLKSDVISSDYVLSYGNYLKLFDVVMHGPLDYLIVVDCKKFNDVVLIGDYLKLDLCRSYSSVEKLGLQEFNTVVNNHTRVMSWNTYPEFKKFKNDSDRIIKLTSKPVMRRIYDLICNII